MTEPPWRGADRLRRKYHDEGLSCYEIADEWGCCEGTVRQWMQRFDIPRRAPSWERPPSFRTDGDGYECWKHQVDGVNRRVAVHRLAAVAWFGLEAVVGNDVHHRNGLSWDNREENLEMLSHGEHMAHHREDEVGDAPWRDEERLRVAYQTATTIELADRWDCSDGTVWQWLKEFGIEIRAPGKQVSDN